MNRDDKKTLTTKTLSLLSVMGIVLANRFGVVGSSIAYGILLVYASRGVAQTLKALSVSVLIVYANLAIARGNFVASGMRFALVAVLLFKVVRAVRSRRKSLLSPFFVRALVLFSLVCMVFAFIQGYQFNIAASKLLTFAAGVVALLCAGSTAKALPKRDIVAWAETLAMYVIGGTFAILSFARSYAYFAVSETGVRGLRGPFSHPNSMSLIAGLLATFLFSVLLFDQELSNGKRRLLALESIILVAIVYLSQGRSGMFGVMAGLASGLAIAIFGLRPALSSVRTAVKRERLIFATAGISFLVIVFDSLTARLVSRSAESFIMKGKTEQTVGLSAMYSSRSDIVATSWNNFLENPIAGIGFGTSRSEQYGAKTNSFAAPIEKGFLPTAILEETGIIGAVLFCWFLFLLYKYMFKRRYFVAICCLTAFIFVNMGEVTMFSIGGLGVLGWLIVALGMQQGRTEDAPKSVPVAVT